MHQKESRIKSTTNITTKTHLTIRPNDRSTHIMNVSCSLIGICLVMATSLKMFARKEQNFVGEVMAVATVLFMISCVLSFLSIRRGEKSTRHLENAADVIFFVGLTLLFVTTLLFSFNVIK